MHCELMFPTLYLKAADLKGRDAVLTIRAIGREDLAIAGSSRKEGRWILYFEETLRRAQAEKTDEKRLVLNKTNMRTIKKLYGAETEAWAGKRVALFPTTAKFQGDDVEAIRIRPSIPSERRQRQEQPQPPTTEQQPEPPAGEEGQP